MKHSEALRKARRYIESDSERYICIALSRIQCSASDVVVIDEVKKRISSRLGDFAMLEGWLRKQARVKGIDFPIAIPLSRSPEYRLYRERLTKTRLNWIDSLIAEYEAEGK